VRRDCPQPYPREEALTDQIATVLIDHSIPDDWADWMIGELQAEQKRGQGATAAATESEEREIKKLDQKIDRLTAGYLEGGAFSPAEFKKRKEEMVVAKRALMDKATARSREDVLRFEPVIRFIHRSRQAKNVASRSEPAELRTEFQNIGSNPRLDNRRLVFDPRGAWKTVVGQGSFAHQTSARAVARAEAAGETSLRPL